MYWSRPHETSKASQAGQAIQAGQASQAGQTSQAGLARQASQANQAGQGARPGRPSRPGQPGKGRKVRQDRQGQPGRTGRTCIYIDKRARTHLSTSETQLDRRVSSESASERIRGCSSKPSMAIFANAKRARHKGHSNKTTRRVAAILARLPRFCLSSPGAEYHNKDLLES